MSHHSSAHCIFSSECQGRRVCVLGMCTHVPVGAQASACVEGQRGLSGILSYPVSLPYSTETVSLIEPGYGVSASKPQ